MSLFRTLLDLSHSHDVTGTVPAIFNRADKLGYISLSHSFRACAMELGLSLFSVTFHLRFQRMNSSSTLIGCKVICVHLHGISDCHILLISNNGRHQSHHEKDSLSVLIKATVNSLNEVVKKWQTNIPLVVIFWCVSFGAFGDWLSVACLERYQPV